MPVLQTYQAIGQREDLTNDIVNISPTETPCWTSFRKVKATARRHDWQTQALATQTVGGAAVVEGVDATFPTLTPTTLLSNYVETFRKAFWVSKDMEAVSKAGRDSEYAFQAEIAMNELAIAIEIDTLRQTSASGASATVRTLQGVLAAIATNTRAGADIELDEPLLNDMLQTCFDSGGKPNVIYTNGWQKRAISGFTGPTGLSRNIALADKTLINAVDYYDSNFGKQKVILNRHLTASSIILLEQAMWRVAILRPIQHFPLTDDGGGPRGMIEGGLTLEYGNEASSGEINNLTTS